MASTSLSPPQITRRISSSSREPIDVSGILIMVGINRMVKWVMSGFASFLGDRGDVAVNLSLRTSPRSTFTCKVEKAKPWRHALDVLVLDESTKPLQG